MFCTSCRAANHEGARYCFKCGDRIRVPTGAKSEPPRPNTSAPGASEPSTPSADPAFPATAFNELSIGGSHAQPRRPPACAPRAASFAGTANVRSSNWFARHWRGDLSLATSYWINGIALNGGAYLLGLALNAVVTPTEHPYWAMGYLAGFWILILLPQTWLWGGIWRSASRTTRDTGHSLWPTVAKGAVVIGALYTAGLFLEGDYGVRAFPALAESAQDQKEFSVYIVRPLRHGSELEISGGIGPGISDALRAQLRANPEARVVHLNSLGGMVAEAKKLRDLIRERHLVTDTSTGCASACTLAFLGGESRLLEGKGRLGFHQPKIPALRGSALKAVLQAEEQYLVTCGVTRDFAHKVMLTPRDTQWYPTPAELLDAHVITGTTR